MNSFKTPWALSVILWFRPLIIHYDHFEGFTNITHLKTLGETLYILKMETRKHEEK